MGEAAAPGLAACCSGGAACAVDAVAGWAGGPPLVLAAGAFSAGLAGGGLTLCFTFLVVGGGIGTLCADGWGKGEASGLSVFSACCVVGGWLRVPFPVCKGGACACAGGGVL